MITRTGTVVVCVSDQDKALDFYANTLGFKKRADEPMGPEVRRIEVSPQGDETRFMLFTPPGLEDRIGIWMNLIFECDDIHATYEELNGRGVKFSEKPYERFGGMAAQFKDQDGNEFGLYER